MTKRWLSWLFLVAALFLTVSAIGLARHSLTVLTRWKLVEGKLLRRELLRNHDADGYLYFRMQATFQYPVDGKEVTSPATSYFGSSDFGWIARKFYVYLPGQQFPLRYDPARPEVIEFAVGFNSLYLQVPLWCLWAAAVSLLLGWLLWRFSGPLPRCIQCRRSMRPYYRYCPECGESISAA